MTYFKFLLCLLLSGCCLSTRCQAQEKRLPEAYTLRWTTYAGNSLPMITLLLSDGQLHKFVVDTGAPSSVIDSDVAKDLRLPIETVTFAGGSKYLLVKTPANFGPSVFQLPQLPLILTDLREFRKVDPSLHGILGTNVLDFFALAFDFSRQQLTFIPGGNVAGTPQELQGAHMLPLLSRDDHWWVEGSLDGLPVHFILDTGADSIAVEDPALLASFKPVRSIEGLPTIILVDESTRSMRVATKLLRLHRLTVGDMTLVDPVVQFVPRREKTTYNSLGIAFLQRYRVVLDFPAKKLKASYYIHPQTNLPKVFISELELERCSPGVQAWIRSFVTPELRHLAQLGERIFLEPSWKPVSLGDYNRFHSESEYAGWISAFGIQVNHFTVLVNRLRTFASLEALNTFLIGNGFQLNTAGSVIKGTPVELLEQTSTMARRIPWIFAEGQSEDVMGCYYEFARRYPLLDGNGLFQGFIPQSADKIFESTFDKKPQ